MIHELRKMMVRPHPRRLVRHLVTSYHRRERYELQRRAMWAEGARQTPTLRSWLDGDEV